MTGSDIDSRRRLNFGRLVGWAANVVLLVAAALVLVAYGSQWVAARDSKERNGKDGRDSEGAPQAVPYEVGERFEVPPTSGLAFEGMERTAVIAIKTGCRFCSVSVPFYRQLIAGRRRATRVVMIHAEAAKTAEDYLALHQLRPDSVFHIPNLPRIVATPTVLVIDRGGAIKGVWQGALTPAQEVEVAQLMTTQR